MLIEEKFIKEIEVNFSDFVIEEVTDILNEITLFEVEYIDFLENNVFYNNEIIKGLTKYDKSFYMSFMEELKKNETLKSTKYLA